MKHLYEIFERFPDDSSLWRESALGAGAAQRKLMDMSKKSLNKFYAIDLTSGEVTEFDRKRGENSCASRVYRGIKERRSIESRSLRWSRTPRPSARE
jgi:hypothetical protein